MNLFERPILENHQKICIIKVSGLCSKIDVVLDVDVHQKHPNYLEINQDIRIVDADCLLIQNTCGRTHHC